MKKLISAALAAVLLVSFSLVTIPAVVAEEDTTPPSSPSLITSFPSSTEAEPVKVKTKTITLSGSGEPGATVKVWTSVSPFIEETLAAEVTVGADGMWSATITPTAGVVTRIRVSQVDAAGNESPKTLYGYVKVDATAPVITDLAIEGVVYVAKVTTDKPSILLAGKVTDDVSGPTGITLMVSYAAVLRTVALAADGTFSTTVPLSEGLNIIVLTATDEAGNVTPATTLEVERIVESLVAPTLPPAAIMIQNISANIGQTIQIEENGVASVTVESAQVVVINFEEEQPVKTISVTTSISVETVATQIEHYTQKPATVPEPTVAMPGIVVSHYLDIAVASPAPVESVKIEFKVPKSWLEANNIDPATVKLLRYEAGQWVELPTTAAGEDGTHKYYTATTTGFSTFAVVGKAAPSNLILIVGIFVLVAIVALVAFYLGFLKGRKVAEPGYR